MFSLDWNSDRTATVADLATAGTHWVNCTYSRDAERLIPKKVGKLPAIDEELADILRLAAIVSLLPNSTVGLKLGRDLRHGLALEAGNGEFTVVGLA